MGLDDGDQIHDVKAAVRWLRANAEHYHLHPERIGVWGFSAGGHLAALAGVTGDVPALEGNSGSAGYSSKVQAVVAAGAPSDFFCPGGHIEGSREVKHLFGGTIHDEVVPFEHAKHMYEALKAAGGEVTLLSTQEGHDWGAGWYELAQQYLAFFRRSLCP